jgi:hypothetical protein
MRRRTILYLALVVLVAVLVGYVYVYQAAPFSEAVNNFLIAAADPVTALLAALAVTAVLLYYTREDKTYAVWLCFTIALWAWVAAETTFSVINLTTGDVPGVGLPDVFWFVGYGLFSVALRSQYQLVYQTKIGWSKVIAAWVGILVLNSLVLLLANFALGHNEVTLDNFVEYLYATVDFALCIASMRLFMTFGGGKLSRPWLGLFVMGISDAVYALLNATGQYQVSSAAGTWLSIFTDTSYVAAYLLLGLGFLTQYLLLRLGPEAD